MTSGGDDRSVRIDGDARGVQIVTGDGNDAVMKGVKVELPPAETVDAKAELAELRALLASLRTAEAEDVTAAVSAAEKEAARYEPDKGWIATNLERALRLARVADDFGEKAESIAGRVAALASWLGDKGPLILAAAGLSA